jgi:hypothetical protein
MNEKKYDVEHRPIPELDRNKRRAFKVPPSGEFYRSRTKRRMQPQENLSETEDEVSEDWLMIKHEEVIHFNFQTLMKTLDDFTDCTAREIRFMKLWDRFVNQDRPRGNKHLPDSIIRFAHSHHEILNTEHLRSEFWKFLLNLKQYNRINNMVVRSAMTAITPKDIVKQESSPRPTPKSPAKSPRTPKTSGRAPVPSAIVKKDEGTYCLCRSVWCNGMVSCANEDCKYQWYHLACINLWKRPPGKWVCPKYSP